MIKFVFFSNWATITGSLEIENQLEVRLEILKSNFLKRNTEIKYAIELFPGGGILLVNGNGTDSVFLRLAVVTRVHLFYGPI